MCHRCMMLEGSLQLRGLAALWISYGFDEHRNVVKGGDRIGDYVFESFQWVLGLDCALHEVGIHAAGYG